MLQIQLIISRLEESFLTPQIPKSADIGEDKGEAKLIFVAHRTQSKAPVFHVRSAAIPIVRDLRRSVLQKAEVGVESDIGGTAEAALTRRTVSQQNAELIEDFR